MPTAEQRYVALLGAFQDVDLELQRAVCEHKPINSTHEGYALLKEKLDEMWAAIKANKRGYALEEATQVAAMAFRYIMDVRTIADRSPPVPNLPPPSEKTAKPLIVEVFQRQNT